MTINVVGLECSGTKWLRDIVALHPDVTEVRHYSFPCGEGEKRGYPEMLAADLNVIVTRDKTCQELSVVNNGYNDGQQQGKFRPMENMNALIQALKNQDPKTRHIFVSYETLLVWRQWYLDWVFELMGLTPLIVRVEYKDGNRKYVW